MTNPVPIKRRKMRRVILESPWAGEGGPLEHLTLAQRVGIHRRYAHAALRDCLGRGEAPFASHLLYTDAYPEEGGQDRVLCMAAGFEWGRVAEACVVYDDLGITVGMVHGIANARSAGADVLHRQLSGEWAIDVVLASPTLLTPEWGPRCPCGGPGYITLGTGPYSPICEVCNADEAKRAAIIASLDNPASVKLGRHSYQSDIVEAGPFAPGTFEWSKDEPGIFGKGKCNRCKGEWDSGTLIGGFGWPVEALCKACLQKARDSGEVVQEAAKLIDDPYKHLLELEEMESAGATIEETCDRAAKLERQDQEAYQQTLAVDWKASMDLGTGKVDVSHELSNTTPHQFMDHTDCHDAKSLGQKMCDNPSCWMCEGSLGMCRVCRQAEAELEEHCPGPPPPKPEPAEPYRHLSIAEFEQLLVNLTTGKERRRIEAGRGLTPGEADLRARREAWEGAAAALPTDRLSRLLPSTTGIVRETIHAELTKREAVFDAIGVCKVCKRSAPLVDGECPECRH